MTDERSYFGCNAECYTFTVPWYGQEEYKIACNISAAKMLLCNKKRRSLSVAAWQRGTEREILAHQ
jgi:hypothetical protein